MFKNVQKKVFEKTLKTSKRLKKKHFAFKIQLQELFSQLYQYVYDDIFIISSKLSEYFFCNKVLEKATYSDVNFKFVKKKTLLSSHTNKTN